MRGKSCILGVLLSWSCMHMVPYYNNYCTPWVMEKVDMSPPNDDTTKQCYSLPHEDYYTKVCGPIMFTSSSIHIYNHWIGSRIVYNWVFGPKHDKVNKQSGLPFTCDTFFIYSKGNRHSSIHNVISRLWSPPTRFKPNKIWNLYLISIMEINLK